MMTFRNNRLEKLELPVSSLWLLTDITAARERERLLTRGSPRALAALAEAARVESVESSNRIEGITVEALRLRPLVLARAKPKTRSEEEILGYRRGLDRIHRRWQKLHITPELLLELHGTVQAGSGDAGQWKHVDNDIVELSPTGPPRLRFRTVRAQQAAEATTELCSAYREAVNASRVPPLVAVAALVFDFLCIHPFRDGNGRLSRLLTLLALYHHGFEVGRYISLERLVEESREDYYHALEESSRGWHQGRHDLTAWLLFFLGIVRRAYREFEALTADVRLARGGKTAVVEAAMRGFSTSFSLAELAEACPSVSPAMVRKVLRQAKSRGEVKPLGRGPGARWRRT